MKNDETLYPSTESKHNASSIHNSLALSSHFVRRCCYKNSGTQTSRSIAGFTKQTSQTRRIIGTFHPQISARNFHPLSSSPYTPPQNEKKRTFTRAYNRKMNVSICTSLSLFGFLHYIADTHRTPRGTFHSDQLQLARGSAARFSFLSCSVSASFTLQRANLESEPILCETVCSLLTAARAEVRQARKVQEEAALHAAHEEVFRQSEERLPWYVFNFLYCGNFFLQVYWWGSMGEKWKEDV